MEEVVDAEEDLTPVAVCVVVDVGVVVPPEVPEPGKGGEETR